VEGIDTGYANKIPVTISSGEVMGIVVGYVIWIVTFPGRIMRTISYRLFMDLTKIQVFEVDYFKGTLTHSVIPRVRTALLIACAPLLVNTILCAILMFPVALPALIGADLPPALMVLGWLGLSLGMNAFPDRRFSSYLLELGALAEQRQSAGVLGRVLCGLFGVANFLRRLWFDLIYALVVGLTIPLLVRNTYL
jgi:hypothetical protein